LPILARNSPLLLHPVFASVSICNSARWNSDLHSRMPVGQVTSNSYEYRIGDLPWPDKVELSPIQWRWAHFPAAITVAR
jgi:hypothetical protein